MSRNKLDIEKMYGLLLPKVPCSVKELLETYKSANHMKSDKDCKKAINVWIYSQDQQTIRAIQKKWQETQRVYDHSF